MIVYRPRHEIDCTPDRFWELYLDADFQDRMFIDGLGWSSPEITIVREDDDELVRKMEAYPRIDIPGGIAKLIKQKLGYVEEARYSKKDRVFRMRHRTNIFGEKVRLEGEFSVEPVGETRCRRVAKLEVEAYVFGVGRLLEKAVEINMKKGWDDSARFFNRWIAKHPAP